MIKRENISAHRPLITIQKLKTRTLPSKTNPHKVGLSFLLFAPLFDFLVGHFHRFLVGRHFQGGVADFIDLLKDLVQFGLQVLIAETLDNGIIYIFIGDEFHAASPLMG